MTRVLICCLVVGAFALFTPAHGQGGGSAKRLREHARDLREQNHRLQNLFVESQAARRSLEEKVGKLQQALAPHQGPLNQRVDLDADDVTLQAVLETLSLQGLEVRLDPTALPQAQGKLTLKLSSLPLRHALDTMLLNTGGEHALGWVHTEGVVTVQ